MTISADSSARQRLLPEHSARLGETLGKRRKFRYWYDFGDDWWHTITIDKRLPGDPATPAAVFIEGENACPPEDCGGPWGYADLLEALADPDHPERSELAEWAGDVDPGRFDAEAARQRLSRIRHPRAKRIPAK